MWTTGPEARGVGLKEEPKGIFILSFLMPHALRLEPFAYAAVMKDDGNPDGVGTDGRFPTASNSLEITSRQIGIFAKISTL